VRPIAYLKASSAEAALAAAGANGEAAYLAGGTSLIDLMRLEVLNPPELIDINALPLTKVEKIEKIEKTEKAPGQPGGLLIGAMVRNSDLAHHPEVIARYPVLSEALLSGASAQLRNMATVGGNLLQRTRCYYYRDPATACNKRSPGQGCAALEGYDRIHAILGTSPQCIASHPSDMCVALAALDAVIHTRGAGGERRIPMADFHLLPGDHPERETVLHPGELVTAVELPALTGFAQSRYLKVRDRASYAFALASGAAALRIEGGVVRDARLALGGVGTKPWRAREAERVLIGKPPDPAVFRQAADAALADAQPRRGNAFKVELARRTVMRVLATVPGAAGQGAK
jgi:xanthine dehydrogenase YagS FAD-binding subunit